MKLSQLLGSDVFIPPEWDREFNHIVVDSRDIQRGDLFIARRGQQAHGEQHISDAVARGAVAVLAEGTQGFRCEWNEDGDGVPVFVLPQVGTELQNWLHRRYVLSAVSLTAVTGTNGKSSVSQYIAQLANGCGSACGVLGTLGNGRWPELKPTRNTTPDLSVVLRELDELQQQDVRYAALEVSSHGLDQQRVAGIPFKVAVLTNISQDHLDYHGSMDDYYAAKRRLFTEYAPACALINIDDEYGRRLAADDAVSAEVITFGNAADASVRYQALALDAEGMQARLTTPWGEADIHIPLIGEFNLVNVCAAVAALALQGFSFAELCAATENLQPVAGRMELYVKAQAPLAVIDFAHTPDALLNVLQALKPWHKPLTCVFGCGGDRDRSKRPLMAATAVRYADQVWLTDDNPRSEDPQQIFNDALAGAASVHAEHDRASAIQAALQATPADGIVVIAGKGHEDYQEVLGVKHAYSDAAELTALGYCKAGLAAGGWHDQ